LFQQPRQFIPRLSRIEGVSSTGTPLYRAVFTPFHGTAWESHHGIDCPAYQSHAAALAPQGYGTAFVAIFRLKRRHAPLLGHLGEVVAAHPI